LDFRFLASVVIPALQDVQGIARHGINQPVFIGNPSRPMAAEIVLEGFRFAGYRRTAPAGYPESVQHHSIRTFCDGRPVPGMSL
jgi:hypothetical protein